MAGQGWRIALILTMSLVLAACEIPRVTFNDPSSPLTTEDLVGVWSSVEGDGVMVFLSDGTLSFHNVPGDVWNDDSGSSIEMTSGRGTWKLCASRYPRSNVTCGGSVPGRVDALRIDIREVIVDGVREIRQGNGYFAITGDAGDRVVWFHPDDYYNSDPRTKFTRQ